MKTKPIPCNRNVDRRIYYLYCGNFQKMELLAFTKHYCWY